MDDDFKDQLCYFGIALFVFASIPFAAAFEGGRKFLLDTKIAVPEAGALLPIEGTGLGLDLARLLIAGGAGFILLVVAIAIGRHYVAKHADDTDD
jgi:hypothetical protein